MQKYVKKVRGKNNKLYKIIKYTSGSNSHHYNKRRLKKAKSINYMLKMMRLFKDTVPEESDMTYLLDPVVTKHRYNRIATNMAYDEWRWGELGKPFIKKYKDSSTNTKKNSSNKIQNDSVANEYINDYDDLLDVYVDETIKNPLVNTVSQFVNYMFAHYNTLVKVTDDHGKPLKYWHLMELNGFHHCPEESTKWFSQRVDMKNGYTAQNIKYGLRHNSIKKIRLSEEYIPAVSFNSNIINIFELWGDIGVYYNHIQNYLKDKYNVIPFSQTDNLKKLTNYINRFIKTGKVTSLSSTNSNMISRVAGNNYTEVNYMINHYQNKKINNKIIHVIPVKLIMPNQRTAFYRLMKQDKHVPPEYKYGTGYLRHKMVIRKNKRMEDKDGCNQARGFMGGGLIKHSLAILANRSKRLKQGLDWLMHNKRFERDKDAEYVCTNYDDYNKRYLDRHMDDRYKIEKGLSEILISY